MNRQFLLSGICVVAPSLGLAQSSGESKALADLKGIYQNQSKAIVDKYRANLSDLEKAQVKAGKVPEALGTRKEIQKVDAGTALAATGAAAVNSPIADTKWVNRSQGESIIEFSADGTWTEHWVQHNDQHGKWKPTDNPRTIQVTFNGGGSVNYHLTDDSKACFRMRDGFLYMRMP